MLTAYLRARRLLLIGRMMQWRTMHNFCIRTKSCMISTQCPLHNCGCLVSTLKLVRFSTSKVRSWGMFSKTRSNTTCFLLSSSSSRDGETSSSKTFSSVKFSFHCYSKFVKYVLNGNGPLDYSWGANPKTDRGSNFHGLSPLCLTLCCSIGVYQDHLRKEMQ